METTKTILDKAILQVKNELRSTESPDVSAQVIQRLHASKTNVVPIKRYMIAAAIAMLSLNAAASWYVWSYQTDTSNEQALEELYTSQSSWSTFLTQAE
ncbi:hypothetical protein EP331_13850 [bacterium]|nr:MAG: hypothetical protein EP331_13850 [bacterium]